MKNLLFCLAFLASGTLLSAQQVKSVDNTLNAGKVEWLARQSDVGEVPFGKPKQVEFPFKNISTEPMFINWVRTSCHCTAAKWPKDPVPPGETGIITVEYDALTAGSFYKIVWVLTNFDPRNGVPLVISGKVVVDAAEK